LRECSVSFGSSSSHPHRVRSATSALEASLHVATSPSLNPLDPISDRVWKMTDLSPDLTDILGHRHRHNLVLARLQPILCCLCYQVLLILWRGSGGGQLDWMVDGRMTNWGWTESSDAELLLLSTASLRAVLRPWVTSSTAFWADCLPRSSARLSALLASLYVQCRPSRLKLTMLQKSMSTAKPSSGKVCGPIPSNIGTCLALCARC